jgi:hypothetical protein
MSVHFVLDSQSGQVNVSSNMCTENLTPGEPRYEIFFELSGCAHILPLPGAEVESGFFFWSNHSLANFSELDFPLLIIKWRSVWILPRNLQVAIFAAR